MANIGELTVGLRFDTNEGSLQASARQAQQILNRGIVVKPVIEDTEMQRRIQASTNSITRTEQESLRTRKSAASDYANWWKTTMADQERATKQKQQNEVNAILERIRVERAAAAERKQVEREAAAAAKQTAAAKKAAENEYSNWWKSQMTAQVQQERAAAAQRTEALNQVRLAHTRLQSAYAEELRNATSWRDRVTAAQNYRTAINGVEAELRRLMTQTGVTTRELMQMEGVQRRINNERLKLNGVNNPLSGLGSPEGMNAAATIVSTLSPSLGAAAMNGSMVAQSFTSILGVSGPMAVGLGAVALAVGAIAKVMGEAVNAAADFERGMDGITSIQDMTARQTTALAQNFQKLSTDLPVTTDQITGIARNAVLLGVEGSASIEQFTKSVAMLGVATRENNKGFVDMSKMAEDVAIFLNETGTTAETFAKDMDSVVATLAAVDQVTPGTIQGVLNLTRYMAAGSVTLNLSRESILGIAGALSGLGANAEGGGSAVIRVLMAMNRAANGGSKELDELGQKLGITKDELANLFEGNPTAKLDAFARMMGVTTEEATRLINTQPDQAFLKLAQGMHEAHTSGQNMTAILDELGLKNVRDIRLVDQMTVGHNLLAKAINAAADSDKNKAALQERVSKATDNYRDSMTKAKNATTVFLQTAGEPMLKWLTGLANGWVTAMNSMSAYFAKMNAQSDTTEIYKHINELTGQISTLEKVVARQQAGKITIGAAPLDENLKRLKELREELAKYQQQLKDMMPPVAGPNMPVGNIQAAIGLTGKPISQQFGITATSVAMRGKPGYEDGTHKGVDFGIPVGTKLFTPGDVRVVKAATGWNEGYGTMVKMLDEYGNTILMAHLSQLSKEAVQAAKTGATLKKGTLVGLSGSTGQSSGPHLHLETRDSQGRVFNPLYYGGSAMPTGTPVTTAPKTNTPATPTDPNAKLKASLAQAHHLLNQYRAAVQSGNELWITKASDAIKAFRKAKGAWNNDLQKELASINKMKADATPPTDAQFVKAQKYIQDLKKAQEGHDPKAIGAATTAMNKWRDASASNARALAAVQASQSGLTKGTKDYVATQADLKKYGAQALKLAQDQSKAYASGSAEQRTAAELAIKKWVGTSAARKAVLEVETAAFKQRQQNDEEAHRKAEQAAREEEQRQKQRQSVLSGIQRDIAAGRVEAARTALEEVKSDQRDELALHGDTAAARERIIKASSPGILAAARALNAKIREQEETATKEWAKGEDAKRLTQAEREAEIARRNKISRDKEKTENEKAQREQDLAKQSAQKATQEEEKRLASELAGYKIAEARSTAERLRGIEDAQVKAAEGDLDRQAELTEIYAKRQYDRAIKIAAAERDKKKMDATGPNAAAAKATADAEYTAAESAARIARNQAISNARTKVQEDENARWEKLLSDREKIVGDLLESTDQLFGSGNDLESQAQNRAAAIGTLVGALRDLTGVQVDRKTLEGFRSLGDLYDYLLSKGSDLEGIDLTGLEKLFQQFQGLSIRDRDFLPLNQAKALHLELTRAGMAAQDVMTLLDGSKYTADQRNVVIAGYAALRNSNEIDLTAVQQQLAGLDMERFPLLQGMLDQVNDALDKLTEGVQQRVSAAQDKLASILRQRPMAELEARKDSLTPREYQQQHEALARQIEEDAWVQQENELRWNSATQEEIEAARAEHEDRLTNITNQGIQERAALDRQDAERQKQLRRSLEDSATELAQNGLEFRREMGLMNEREYLQAVYEAQVAANQRTHDRAVEDAVDPLTGLLDLGKVREANVRQQTADAVAQNTRDIALARLTLSNKRLLEDALTRLEDEGRSERAEKGLADASTLQRETEAAQIAAAQRRHDRAVEDAKGDADAIKAAAITLQADLTQITSQGIQDRRTIEEKQVDWEIANARRRVEKSYGLEGQDDLVSALQKKMDAASQALTDMGPHADTNSDEWQKRLQALLDLQDQLADAKAVPNTLSTWQQAIGKLGQDFASQKITAEEFTNRLQQLNPKLLELADAADKAGDPKSAQGFRDLEASLRAMTPEIAAVLQKMGKMPEYLDYFQKIAGAFGKFASAMGEAEQEFDSVTGAKLQTPWKDAAANIEGATNLAGKLLDIATDVMKLIANPADVGAWVSLLTKVVSSIADAIAGFQKAKAAAQQAKDDFASSNPYLNAADFQKVSIRSRGWLADMFGGGPQVVNEIDKVGVQFANSFAQHVADGFASGLKKAVMEGDTSQIGKNLRQNTFEGIVDGMIESFKTEVIKDIMAPFLKEWSAAMKTPDTADDQAALNTLDSLMPRLDQAGQAWANTVIPRLQTIQQQWGLTPDATGSNTGSLFGNAPGVQLGVPEIHVSLPEAALKPIADLSSTVARLETLLDKGLTLNTTTIQISLPDSFLQANALFNSSVSIFAGAVPAFAAGSADLKLVPAEFRTVFAEILTFVRRGNSGSTLPPLSGNGGLA